MIEQWIEDDFQPTLIMVGPPGSGKTQFVKALAWEHGWNLFMVNHKKGIKDLNEDHTGVFFDDVSSNFINYGNITNNVQINIHNHIYNNPAAIKANQQAIRDIRNSRE